jgi:hypothetical protein
MDGNKMLAKLDFGLDWRLQPSADDLQGAHEAVFERLACAAFF